MIEIGRASSEMQCDVCGRTLLTGERFVRYHRVGADDAQVCELCTEGAEARGWVREGSPTLPVQLEQRREKGLKRFFQGKPRHLTAPEPFDPELLPADPKDAVEAGVELFNESTHPRTVSGIARTLGEPRVSVVQRSHREVVVTVAWDLSWYQYRIDMLGAQTVTLQHRGDDVDELDNRFCDWNAQADADGTVALAGAGASSDA
ncbi:MAG TPA: hypothetical protein VM785_09790 [Gaiellales bacterium]|nr:hypothetical protein [Gaiellales bacterium]